MTEKIQRFNPIPREELESQSPLAIALRARETLSDPDKWTTGNRHDRGRMCITGHLLHAMGAKRRCERGFMDMYAKNFDVTQDQYILLDRICIALGFYNYSDAESFNDSCWGPGRNNHEERHAFIFERYDRGLRNWHDVDEETLEVLDQEEPELV